MLEQLKIKNVAVIDELSVSFGEGLSVLTGETGAGKSIIIDSINMILGERANKDLVRGGTDCARVEAVFEMTEELRGVLSENDIDCDDDSVIISRKISSDGKSSARINGSAVTLNMLRDISEMLINIHGQHDNRALLSPNKHINFLDEFAKTGDSVAEYRQIYDRRNALLKELERLEGNTAERIQRADLLLYQVNEIDAARLTESEEEELIAQRSLLERAEEITEKTALAVGCLYDSENSASAYDLISEAQRALESVSDTSEVLKEAYASVTDAMYAVEETARQLRDFSGNIEFDEEELNEIEERLDLINRLKRKYGGSVAAVIEYEKKARAELDETENIDERTDAVRRELESAEIEIGEKAEELSEKRRRAARTLEREIEASLRELNMEKSRFSVSVEPKKYAADGADSVEFLISTNPGEPLKPLVKIASGGELSRVMLAIKSILVRSDAVDSMIFDEIDTGVSGGAAQKIADKLKTIAESAQVICITHLPQLASAADSHYLIEKNTDGEMASTTLTLLDTDGRIAEIARIVGGGSAGEDYAKSLLKK